MANVEYFVGEQAEPAFLAWLRTHEHGYVVNCDRKPRASYLRLHAATCRMLMLLPGGAQHHTKMYGKACATDVADLETWAKRQCGSEARLQPCHFCS
jgi:hypothetical protein